MLWIDRPLASALRDMAGFRNILVHGHEKIDLAPGATRPQGRLNFDRIVHFLAAWWL